MSIFKGLKNRTNKKVLNIFFTANLRLHKKTREGYQELSEQEKNKKLQDAHEWYRNLSEEEKNEKQKYGRKRCKNLPEDEKQRPVEYRKNYSKMWKIDSLHE